MMAAAVKNSLLCNGINSPAPGTRSWVQLDNTLTIQSGPLSSYNSSYNMAGFSAGQCVRGGKNTQERARQRSPVYASLGTTEKVQAAGFQAAHQAAYYRQSQSQKREAKKAANYAAGLTAKGTKRAPNHRPRSAETRATTLKKCPACKRLSVLETNLSHNRINR